MHHACARRMQLHLVTKEIWNVAMALYPYLPVWAIDKLVLLMCAVVFGDTSAVGPFTMKLTTPAYPVVDVGTYAKIRSGEIRVLPAAVKSVRGNVVEFGDVRQPTPLRRHRLRHRLPEHRQAVAQGKLSVIHGPRQLCALYCTAS